MKKIVKTLLLVVIVAFIFTGCKKEEKTKSTTPASVLADEFVEIVKYEKDLSIVAQKLSENEIIQTKMIIEEKSNNDYLNGFDAKIENFDKAYVIQPKISSIPFIMYLFETNNATELEKELKNNSNPRWNICVEADETNIKIADNYVFFVMAPKSFE